MKSKSILVAAVVTLSCFGPAYALDERQGFVMQLNDTSDVLTVPQGKRFVILQILTRSPHYRWNLNIDGDPFLNEKIFGLIPHDGSYSNSGIAANFDVTFPDRCVTVEHGQALSFEEIWPEASITIIGYLYNFHCDSYPLSDLNKDCKVDLADMAILASEWLKDNTA